MGGGSPVKTRLFLLFTACTFFWTPGNCESSISIDKPLRFNYGTLSINCTDSGKGRVYWERINGKRLPKRAKQSNGRLVIPNFTKQDEGEYVCFNDRNEGKVVHLKLNAFDLLPNSPKPIYSTAPTFTTSRPCLDGTCNKINETSETFECSNGETIPKSLVCNRVRNCKDGSDETKCEPWPPKITLLPKPKLEVFCGDQDPEKLGSLVLECEAAGFPVPLIKWKKYEGHVPSKCVQFSKDGRGSLTCPDFKQSDQGAYSCVAENSQESSESQPKSVVKCSNTIHCKGFKVLNEDQIENCLDCFCSGRTTNCQGISSSFRVQKFPLPETKTEVFADKDGKILFVPSNTQLRPDDKLVQVSHEITYCSLIDSNFEKTSLLKSYGRNINIPRYKEKKTFLPNAPDLLIQGNGVSLMYSFSVISPSLDNINIRFWPGNWHKLDGSVATRLDLMKVLSNVDAILLRCEYKEGETMKWKEKTVISIESGIISNFSTAVSYIEKCNCPPGYDGLSCETCASGYTKKLQGNGFICERKECEEGRKGLNCEECDSSKGYFLVGGGCVKATCDVDGSVDPAPDSSGKCKCADGVTGDSCHKCKTGFFSLKKGRGCLECWCNGVTKQCTSSSLFKSVISRNPYGGYNSSDGRNFWLLPSDFNGNRLTSYGGHLNYTLKYKPNLPGGKTVLTVEFLTVDEVTLTYTHSNKLKSPLSSPNEKAFVVPLIEKNWKKADNTTVTRGEFLTVLSKIKAIYIESPYHLSSGLANLTSTRLSSASSWDDEDGERAVDVEHCSCPRSHTGLSCESCSVGYYKKRNGISFQCIKCNCTHCDPEHGCLDCPPETYRDNPMEEEKAVCKPCPCNGNGKSCTKDDFGQVICMCKPGFTGMHCEKKISNHNESDFTISIHPRRIIEKKIGAVISLNCSYRSNEDMIISAKKIYSTGAQVDVKSTGNSTLSVSSGKHKIFEVVLDQNIEFVECFVHDPSGKEAGRIRAVIDGLIMVVKPVAIECYQDSIVIKEGESKDLICQATGAPTPTVNWYVTKKDKPTIKVDTTEGVHNIESASLSDNGTIYTCIAENSEGDRAVCARVLLVLEKCDIVVVVPKVVNIKEGGNVTLQCKASHGGAVHWSLFDNVTNTTRSLPFRAKTKEKGLLEITNATVSDSGIYMCKTKSKNREINETAVVTVEEKKLLPTVYISEGDVTLNVGDNYELNCQATGRPAPHITWSKLNDKLPSNVKTSKATVDKLTLAISNATTKNSGFYQCDAKSILGNASAHVLIKVKENRVKPKVVISPAGNITRVEYSEASLECKSVEGIPPPTLTWHKFSGLYWSYVSRSPILKFQNITRNDFGLYKCEGQNSAGYNEARVNIDVQIRPEVKISPESVSVNAGETVTLNCTAYGHPLPVISWVTIPSSGGKIDVSVTKKGVSGRFLKKPMKAAEEQITFTATAKSDGTKVSCIAKNSAGQAEATTTIKILQSGGGCDIETVERVPLGSYHEIMCDFSEENVTVTKVGGLVGDECFIPNGLMIISVQVQHNGTYICVSRNSNACSRKINLIVVGFVPKFSKTSYMVVPVSLKTPQDLRIQMFFSPNHNSGVLLQKQSEDLDIYLKKGDVHLSLYSKDGDFIDIVTNKPLEVGNWYSLALIITKTFVDIVIYDNYTSTHVKKTEYLKNFDIDFSPNMNDSFFVGGTTNKMRHSRKYFLHRLPSFSGSISRLNIDNKEIDMVKQSIFSTNVTLRRRCSDKEDPCKGYGKCLDAPTQYGFICVCPGDNKVKDSRCPSSCVGRGCESGQDLCKLLNPCNNENHECSHNNNHLQCKCAYGYSGTTCEKAQEHRFCARGNGFLKLPSKLLERNLWDVEVIKMSFELNKPEGTLLWQGDRTNYLSIEASEKRLVYTYMNQGHKLLVYTAQELHINEKYKLEVVRTNNTVVLHLNSNTYKNSTEFTTNRVHGDIYLGNVRDGQYIFGSDGLDGCIYYIAFGNKPKVNFHDQILEKLNSVSPTRNCPLGTDCDDEELDENDEYYKTTEF